MRLKEAIEKAEKIKTEGYLASAFAVVKDGNAEEWTLLFYNPAKKTVRDFFVSENSVAPGDTMPSQGAMKPLETDSVNLNANDAISAAKEHFPGEPKSTMVSLHTGKRTEWSVTFIGEDLTATRIDIDAQGGDFLGKKTTSLIRRL